MDWTTPSVMLLAIPAIALLVWAQHRSLHPMGPRRRRWLLGSRVVLLILALCALANPAWRVESEESAVIFVVDHSKSQGTEGLERGTARALELASHLPAATKVGFLSTGESTRVLRPPGNDRSALEIPETLVEEDGAQTDLAGALRLAAGLFPPGASRRVVLLTDGVQTRGDLLDGARSAALKEIVIDVIPIAGERRRDARVVRLRASRTRSHEGASIDLTAEVESSFAATARIRLFENGVEVETRPIELEAGQPNAVTFRRTPDERNLYRYLVRLEDLEGDVIPENDQAATLVEVRGRPLLLYVEGEAEEARYLTGAMAREGIRLHQRPPESIPEALGALGAYDGIIISDVSAHRLSDAVMAAIHDYVELLGGGFLMIGGQNSFGVGGYYRTPIEEILPVKMQSPDKEERHSTALALVLDRSGSMSGAKIEIVKSAAIASAELLQRKDHIGVVAFDSQASWIVPMTRAGNDAAIAGRVAALSSGGGTNIYPGMELAHGALRDTRARVKHMIVLTDGRTGGGNYVPLAQRIAADGITISTVAVGAGADHALLSSIAQAGGGEYYQTADPSNVPRIFTRDTAVHLGQLIRETTFRPRQVEDHPMLEGWRVESAPPLLGYVRTMRRATAQVPLVTDEDDPLLAHWRFGLGKVTAFTSDCKSRWAALWVTGGPTYGQFWGQVIREMARDPQSRNIDIHIDTAPRGGRIVVDLLADASRFRNTAGVDAEVYYLPAGAVGTATREVASLRLDQTGPGRYEGRFPTDEPGLYLIQARTGSHVVSAGHVTSVSAEAPVGRIDRELLARVSEVTGGRWIEEPGDRVAPSPEKRVRFVSLTPWLLRLLLLVFLVDLLLRRWENWLGIRELFGRR